MFFGAAYTDDDGRRVPLKPGLYAISLPGEEQAAAQRQARGDDDEDMDEYAEDEEQEGEDVGEDEGARKRAGKLKRGASIFCVCSLLVSTSLNFSLRFHRHVISSQLRRMLVQLGKRRQRRRTVKRN